MNDDKLVSITRIHIHALERSQIEHNNFVIVLYMLIVVPLYKNVIRRNLLTNEEKEWANRIIYSEYRGIDLHENSYDDFAKVIRNRRSVRRFNEKKITKEQI